MPDTVSLVELEGRRFAARRTLRVEREWDVVDWAMSKVVATGLSEIEAHTKADELEASN